MQARDLLRGRIGGLDGLRTFAIAGVFAAHMNASWLPQGGLGVNVFFVISGFLITALLLAEDEETGRINLRRFYARRLLRLWPALTLLVVVCSLLALFMHGSLHKETLDAAPFALFYVSNWYRAAGHNAGMFSHTWSLSVEEQFYLCWPVLLALAFHFRGRRGVLVAALGLAVASAGLQALLFSQHASPDRLYNGTDTVAFNLLIGGALAVAMVQVPEAVRRIAVFAPVALIGVIAIAAWDANGSEMNYGGLVLLAILCAVMIAAVVLRHDGLFARCFATWPMARLGRISYGIYLWHFPLILLVRTHVSSFVTVLITVPLSIIAAEISFRVLERPILRWRDRRVDSRIEQQVSLSVTEPGVAA